MFNKRKNQSARTGQPAWQEPKVDQAASEGGADAGGQSQQEAQGGAAARQQPGAAKQPPSKPDASAVLNRQPTPPVRPDPGRRAAAAASAQPGQARGTESADSRKLIVGRDISLAGEIRACETLVVEGTVEAELNGTQVLDIEPSGLFKGSATVDTADIAGRFEGNLTVRNRLHVRASGHIHGEIKYYNLEIESGGRIGGTLMELSEDESETAHHKTAARPDAGPRAQAAAGTPNGGPAQGTQGANGAGRHGSGSGF